MNWQTFVLFIIGFLLMIFGLLIVFKKQFLKDTRKAMGWNKLPNNPEKIAYPYDRYYRGLSFFFAGLILIIFLLIKMLGS